MTIADPSSHPKVTWTHLKTGKTYVILHHGLLESSLEQVVVYQEEKGGPVWVRPAKEFFDGRFQNWEKNYDRNANSHDQSAFDQKDG